MKYSPKQYAQALMELCDNQDPARTAIIIDAWLTLIAERGQVSLLPDIQQEIEAHAHRDEIIASVTTAKPLTKELRQWVHDYLTERSKNKQIKINESINKELLLGLVINYNDKKIDLSLKYILNNLKEEVVN